MKKNWIVPACLLLLSQTANALIVNVEGEGEVPEDGMELLVTEAKQDPLTGEMRMDLNGDLLANGTLTVSVSRSVENLVDEFCCAGQCTSGNKQKTEILSFTPEGPATWFTHYTPVHGSDVTVVYTFKDETETRSITVHYIYASQGVESVEDMRLLHSFYSPTGQKYHETAAEELPEGLYIGNGVKLLKIN